MRSATRSKIALLTVVVALSPAVAVAHPGHAGHEALGLWDGLVHPFTGADHLLAMTAVGLWAALRGGKALWAWPAAFLAALIAGFALAAPGVSPPIVEPAILASVMVLGALTAANARVSAIAGVVLIAAFGLAHGYAHGAESAGATEGFPLGMALSTAALHGLGLVLGLGLQRLQRPMLVRWLGAGAALGGLALAVSG
jgi:urease accessory protein